MFFYSFFRYAYDPIKEEDFAMKMKRMRLLPMGRMEMPFVKKIFAISLIFGIYTITAMLMAAKRFKDAF